MNHTVIAVAIDGSWCGRINIARAAAKQLGFIYVDTGALYRTIGLAAYRRGIAGTDTEKIIRMLSQITVGLQHQEGVQSVLLNGEDVRPISVPRKFQYMPRRFLRFRRCVHIFCTYSAKWRKSSRSLWTDVILERLFCRMHRLKFS